MINLELPTDHKITSVYYSGQPRLRRGPIQQKTAKSKSSLDIQGCFNCASNDRLARNVIHLLNLARGATRKLEYLNKKMINNAVHVVLENMFLQPYAEEKTTSGSSIFVSVLNRNDNETKSDASEHTIILGSTLKLNIPALNRFTEPA